MKGQPFDFQRVSDFDVALASPDLLARAKALGISLRSGGARTGPLEARELKLLGLDDLAKSMSERAEREVNFMIYKDSSDAIRRSPSIEVPSK